MIAKALLFSTLVVAAIAACAGTPDPKGDVEVIGPDRAQFDSVQPALELSCGTLECHGQVGRNFRLYGQTGLRLPNSDPFGFSGGGPTTTQEASASYRSLVGLEPERMSEVVVDGADPSTLTLIRKARGLEAHKGGTRMVVGDDLDTCITSWLGGTVDTKSCAVIAPPLE